MVYQNKFVVAIKAGGRVLREVSGVVGLPFGSEYSVLLKNLNSVRALAKVEIDGKDIGEGTTFVVQPNSSMDLERFLHKGNMERGNRFKFIERTSEIEEHRGIKADDGLVRVEFWMERLQPKVALQVVDEDPVFHDYYSGKYPPWTPSYPNRLPNITLSNASGIRGSSRALTKSAGVSFANVDGITVAGSESNQRFVNGQWFPTESQSTVIVLKLRGEVAGRAIDTPVTVDHKQYCGTCGKSNSALSKFCWKCGTALVLI